MLYYWKLPTSNVSNKTSSSGELSSPGQSVLQDLIDLFSLYCWTWRVRQAKGSCSCNCIQHKHPLEVYCQGRCALAVTLLPLPWNDSGDANEPNMYFVQVEESFKLTSDYTCSSLREKLSWCWSLWFGVVPCLIPTLDTALVNHGGNSQHNLENNLWCDFKVVLHCCSSTKWLGWRLKFSPLVCC